MPRNRTIYQSEGVYAGPSPATGIHFTTGSYNNVAQQIVSNNRVKELLRIQSANYSWNIARTDINQFNQLAAIDRVILEQPTVSLDFNYISYGMTNEKRLGFTVATPGSASMVSAISGILNKTEDERNYFVLTVPEGNDSQNYTLNGATNVGVFGIGNAFISSYTAEGSVGNFPTVSVNVEALNIKLDTLATGQVIPAVNPVDGTRIPGWFYSIPVGVQSPDGSGINTTNHSISALRPGDITLTLGNAPFGAAFNDLKIQNYSLSFDLAREPLQKLGSKYAFSREIQFPVTVSLSVTADVGDFVSGDLVGVIDNDATSSYTPIVSIKKPGTSTNEIAAHYELRGCKLDSTEYSSSIGPNKSVTLQFSTQLGGPSDLTQGLFMSGYAF